MKLFKRTFDCGSLVLISVCLCLSAASGRSAEQNVEPANYSTNAADGAACQSQLNRIYGAIQEYQRRNQRLPEWLSDLTPDFIHNPDVLVCPHVRKTGNVKKWREQFTQVPVFGDPAFCTYAYEFCNRAIPNIPDVNCREYKQRQIGLMGYSVPIVRCFAHRPVLNLAMDGNIYESPSEWEDNFARSPADAKLLLLHDIPPKFGDPVLNQFILKLIQPRNAQATARILDLSKHYNALLLHLSQMDRSGKLLVTYPEGLQRIGEIEFDVRGLVHLSGKDSAALFPKRADNIAVNRKCGKIHFLHGALQSAPEGSLVASYVVHQGVRQTEIPIVYGKDVKTRWFDSRQRSELENPKVAWTSPPDRVGTAGKSLRLYLTTWSNPNADAEVNSISFISYLTDPAPFLVAITLE